MITEEKIKSTFLLSRDTFYDVHVILRQSLKGYPPFTLYWKQYTPSNILYTKCVYLSCWEQENFTKAICAYDVPVYIYTYTHTSTSIMHVFIHIYLRHGIIKVFPYIPYIHTRMDRKFRVFHKIFRKNIQKLQLFFPSSFCVCYSRLYNIVLLKKKGSSTSTTHTHIHTDTHTHPVSVR